MDFASTQLRKIRLRKYPNDPKAYLELCWYYRNSCYYIIELFTLRKSRNSYEIYIQVFLNAIYIDV